VDAPGSDEAEPLAREVREAGEQVRQAAEEQAALHRVAILVARAEPPEAVFEAVAEEAGRVVPAADFALVGRYDRDGVVEMVGAWSRISTQRLLGVRAPLGGQNANTLVFERHGPVRVAHLTDDGSAATAAARESGARSSAGAPISVEGRLWGVMIVASEREDALPVGTEYRLAGFAELAATAIANAQARVELRGFAEEQAALRRVATLVARAAPPEEVFAAVTEEAGRLLSSQATFMSRYDPGDVATIVGTWTGTDAAVLPPVGTRLSLGGRDLRTLVFRTGRPARLDDDSDASEPTFDVAGAAAFRSAVGVPISVGGRLWGIIGIASSSEVPTGAEERLAELTNLLATAIANAQARVELRGFAEEQAALRRVATLVARAAPPQEVFAAVTEEAGRVLNADLARMNRYDPEGRHTVVAGWTSTGDAMPVPLGSRWSAGGRNVAALVFQTGQPARIDDYTDAAGSGADLVRSWGLRSAVGAPVSLEGRLWGVLVVGSQTGPLPADTEARLAGFTELVATAIANTEARAALTASRARIVAAADTARRRIERDLHDGAQQRLVSLGLQLRAAQAAAPPGTGELTHRLDGAVTEVTGVLEELREIAHGLHPAVLAEGGLRPALRTLARRCVIPVRLDVQVGRLPEPTEFAAYYTVAEALTNTAKHARASAAEVEVAAAEGMLRVRIRDDGVGGADFGRGTGLADLKDRIESLGGQVVLDSPRGAGTSLCAELPLTVTDSCAVPCDKGGQDDR
jgi:signal transduction histidine kinase